MRLERSRSASRAQGSHLGLKRKSRQPQARDELSHSPNEDLVPRHARLQQLPVFEASFHRHYLRGRTAHQFSDDFETKSDERDLDRSKASKSERGYDHRQSPGSTRRTIEQSDEEAIRENSLESGYAYETDSRSKEYSREQYKQLRKDRLRRSWQTDAYDDAFSGRTGSKSHSSSGSGSSYSSSSDDEDFQLNANCMNALFSKDTERAANLIRCDKAGPSATEVQLKMTLPLPIQLMDGFDHLVPTKREFRSAMKSLKIQSDKFAKNCDFDYNRLDEQVIDEEFAGYAMPHFYKSLFEAPTELSSEGDESSSRKMSSTNTAFKNSKESAFLVTRGISKPFTTSEQNYTNGGSTFRPDSLPSQVMIEENSSVFSSHESLGMLSFGMKKQKKTLILKCDSIGGSRFNAEGPIDLSGTQLQYLGGAALKASVELSQQVVSRQIGDGERGYHHFHPEESRGSLPRLLNEGSGMLHDNPSFDEGNLPSIMSDIGTSNDTLKNLSDRKNLRREKNAHASFEMNSLRNKEWISARKINLDLVHNMNASFDAPDDEVPKVPRDQTHDGATENFTKLAHSLIDGIPTSVDYGRRMTDKHIRTVYSDLTVDEESFEKAEFQVVSSSKESTNHAAELHLPHRSMKTQEAFYQSSVPTRHSTEPSVSAVSGDELMGPRRNLNHPTDFDARVELKDSAHVEVGHFTKSPSMETDSEEGPMDENSRKGRQDFPSHDILGISSAPCDTLSTVSLLNTNKEKAGTGGVLLVSQRNVLRSVVATPLSQQAPAVQTQKQVSTPISDPDLALAFVKKEFRQFSESTNAQSEEGEVPMDEQISGPPASTQVHLLPSFQGIEELHTSVYHNRSETVGQGVSCKLDSSRSIQETACACSDDSPSRASRKLEVLAVKDLDVSGTARLTKDLTSVGFATRLKNAAAARLEAMSTTPTLNLHLKTEMTSHGESWRYESRELDNPASCASDSGVPITTDVGDCIASDFQRALAPNHNASSGDESVLSKKPSLEDDHTQHGATIVQEVWSANGKVPIPLDEDCDVFLDTAEPDDSAAKSEYRAAEIGSREETVRFISEIDARSQAVEINYVGGNRSLWTDSQSLVTESQLVIAPTTTTLGTSLASAHTLFTVDTPVREPSAIFDPCGGSEANRSACPKQAFSDLNCGQTGEYYEEDLDYHFDERHARLSALLPAIELKKVHTSYPTPPILVKSITTGICSILLIVISWLKHLLRIPQRKGLQRLKWIEGEPNFRGWVGHKQESPPTSRQRIQGTRIFRSEIQHMDREEAGIFIEFVVPDVHSRKGASQNRPIWTVLGTKKSTRSQNTEQPYVSRCTSFSRNDVRSLASMKGWSTKPAHSYHDFQE